MIYIGSDHGGFNYKNKIIEYLISRELKYEDLGTDTIDSCDYPLIAKKVVNKVSPNKNNLGILICGTGIGMSIKANRFSIEDKYAIRAAVVHNVETARLSREHNNANVLCLGERVIHESELIDIVQTWLDTPFSNEERHERRVSQLG